MSSAGSEAFVLSIDLAVGIVGFVISLGWGKATGRDMDRDTKLLLAKVWGGIALFGMVLTLIM
jgi:hypothetical protein